MARSTFSEPRVIRLSWRPRQDAAGAPVAEWIARFKKRMAVAPVDRAMRRLILQDLQAPGLDRAATREGRWTDFLAIYTVDYCLGCQIDGVRSELYEAWQRRQVSGVRLWLARLEPGNPADAHVGNLRPWRNASYWIFLPGPYPEAPLSTGPRTLDNDLEARCLRSERHV